MFTVTKDKLLPATVTGSWPRPSWYQNNIHGERFSPVSYTHLTLPTNREV